MKFAVLILSDICFCIGIAFVINSIIYGNLKGFIAALLYTIVCGFFKSFIKTDIKRRRYEKALQEAAEKYVEYIEENAEKKDE